MGFARNEVGRRDVYFIDFYRRLKLVIREAGTSEAVGRVCCRSLFVCNCYRVLLVTVTRTLVCL